MIEQTVLQFLKSRLDVPILMELPEVPSDAFPEWPEQFVVIERVGGGEYDHLQSASLALQSYSTQRLYDAAALDAQVRACMADIVSLDNIGGAHLASNYNHTDTRTKRYRYQCVWDISFTE